MVMGYDLLSTLAQQAEYEEYYKNSLPMACPNDGEPLREGPPQQPGVLWCRFDGWMYPDDYNPDTMGGM